MFCVGGGGALLTGVGFLFGFAVAVDDEISCSCFNNSGSFMSKSSSTSFMVELSRSSMSLMSKSFAGLLAFCFPYMLH
ncbi:hypothetical protein FB192DRAFT_1370575 [Mucor lusitanicus]|uniref:Uncharacterized protein n=1 Tax=Mucor circinelloides f. lusitanicus TaxID=29924 RepID=A0A8H4BM94_MUCCL|nr:hypothetical protein FB192DRAFT_1370575 [Mucor lusitanicus]